MRGRASAPGWGAGRSTSADGRRGRATARPPFLRGEASDGGEACPPPAKPPPGGGRQDRGGRLEVAAKPHRSILASGRPPPGHIGGRGREPPPEGSAPTAGHAGPVNERWERSDHARARGLRPCCRTA